MKSSKKVSRIVSQPLQADKSVWLKDGESLYFYVSELDDILLCAAGTNRLDERMDGIRSAKRIVEVISSILDSVETELIEGAQKRIIRNESTRQ